MTTEKPTLENATGAVLHRGTVSGRDYVAIATFETSNRKTGNMVQVWFLLTDTNPVAAVQSGVDAETVCRGCPFASGKGCYVNVGQAPLSIWRGYHRGIYPEATPADFATLFSGRKVRFGAYGNPTLLPLPIVSAIAAVSEGWTGYFHDWQSNPQAAAYARYFMASTETADSFRAATRAGFRTFHVSPIQPAGTLECLSDAKGLTCEKCKLCDGRFRTAGQPFRPSNGRTLPSVWINPHGSRSAAASAVALA